MLYRVWLAMQKMMEDRGRPIKIVPIPWLIQSKLTDIYYEHLHEDKQGKVVLRLFDDESKDRVSITNLKKLEKMLRTKHKLEKTDLVIFGCITKSDKLLDYHKSCIEESNNLINGQIWCGNVLIIHSKGHTLIGKYKKRNDIKYSTRLPQLREDDIICRWFDFKDGDVLEMERKGFTKYIGVSAVFEEV